MPPNLCDPNHTLLRDHDVLEFTHIPEQFNYRDAQMKDLAFSLRPGLHGASPVNTVLRGLPGTGKTTSVKTIFAEAEETTKRILPVYVNCHSEKTLFAVLSRIHAELFGHSPPPLGNPRRDLLDHIGTALVERNIVLSVCLDDANYLLPDKVLNSVLSTILRIYETYPGAKSGVIATVSNTDTDFFKELDPSVMSVFRPMEIIFPSYSREEIHSILKERATRAFYPGALPGPVLDDIADRASSCGDLRVGLDLLRRAAMLADQEGLKAIGTQHVEAAFEFSKYVQMEHLAGMLNESELSLLAHIARLIFQDPDSSLTTGMLFESAQLEMPISYTSFYKRIRKFDEMRLINVHHGNTGFRGKSREITLRYDPKKVIEVCG